MGACEYRITLEISFNSTLARLNQICICFTPIFSSCHILFTWKLLFQLQQKKSIRSNRFAYCHEWKVSITPFLCIALTRIAIHKCFFSLNCGQWATREQKKYVGKVIEYCFDVMMTAMWSIIPLHWTFSLVSHRAHIANVSIQWWSVNYANWLYSDTFLASAIFTSCPSNQCV